MVVFFVRGDSIFVMDNFVMRIFYSMLDCKEEIYLSYFKIKGDLLEENFSEFKEGLNS